MTGGADPGPETSYQSRLDAARDAWEQVWSGGTSPEVEHIHRFLPAADAREQRRILIELIRIDLRHRYETGNGRPLQEYVDQFPQLGSVAELPDDLQQQERDHRQRSESPVSADSTSVTLLEKLKGRDSQEAWGRFVDLYAPLIFHWARQHGLDVSHASDLVQDVLQTLITELEHFQYDSRRRFRGWLRIITRNRAIDFLRRQANDPLVAGMELEQLEAEQVGDLFEEREYRNFIVQRARVIMRSEFEETTWRAFWLSVTENRSTARIAAELGLSENSVRVAKFRVLRRLRQELQELLE